MIARNYIVKISEKLPEPNAKNSSENSISWPRYRKRTENISLSYDVNDHVYSKPKSI